MPAETYNLLKSRTFWTIVATAIYNIWQLLSPTIPSQYSAIIDVVLTSVAAYFHLDTAKTLGAKN